MRREADVVRLYFGLNGEHPMTLEEIGERFDLTRERSSPNRGKSHSTFKAHESQQDSKGLFGLKESSESFLGRLQ